MLERWNGSSLVQMFAQTIISLESQNEITQEWRKGEWESSSLAYGRFWSKWARESVSEGVWGLLYPLSQKTSRWRKSTRILRVYVWILRTYLSEHSGLREIYGRGIVTRRLRVYVRILRTSPSRYSGSGPGHSGFSRRFHKKTIYSGMFYSHSFYKFFWAQLPRQHL
jgi:hypothetical protein